MTAASDPVVAAQPQRYHVRQKITPFQNTYRISLDAGGEPGALIAFAKQKRLAFKESFTLYRDESATTPVLTIKADRRIDVRSAMTVSDPAGVVVGVLRKKGRASLFRSTWEVEQPGLPVVLVQERSLAVALLRRFWGLIPYAGDLPVPWVFHFDGTLPDGRPALTHTRRWGIRDRYLLEVQEPQLDPRLAIALAVCLDAMQKR
ncbi:MAG: hypothetical protein JWN17_2624 [Frankiales bacterium]|nr:hypothetical protein [Frankiales bacterium]